MQKSPNRCTHPPYPRRTAPQLASSVTFTLLLITGCGTVTISPGAERPGDDSDLSVTATPSALVQQVGFAIELSAAAAGGTPPYLLRWDQNAGPDGTDPIAIADETAESFELPAFDQGGHYVFRIVVTDQTGATATDFAVIDITDSVEATAPTLILVNEPATLTATITDQLAGTTMNWSDSRGTATIENSETENATLTASSGETIGARLTVSIPSGDHTSDLTRDFEIVSVFNLRPEVLMETSLGAITIRLDADAAPKHAANFLAYVDDRFFDGLIFHRASCSNNPDTGECDPFVVQGGGFERIGGELIAREVTRDPVQSESPNGLSNGEIYSVALALSGGDVNSGTTQFFINMSAGNDFLDAQNFTVFGSVVSGTDVVDAIAAVDTTANELLGGELSLPVEDVIIERVSRIFP